MSSLEDEMIAEKGKQYTNALRQSMTKALEDSFAKAYGLYQQPDYYSKRKYGKWTIYNKDGMRVAWGLNEKEMKRYMKLLEEEK